MKWLYLFSLLTLMHMSVFGQTPEKMSYQAVIRDNSDVLLKNSNVNLKIIVRQGSSNGSSVYEETHYTKTNKNGLLSLEIGSGMVEKGSFKDIIWAEGPFFIETLVDIKGNSSYKINGVSEMLSVPYSLHAKSADSFTGTISPSQMPDFYTADEIDNILLDINTGEGVSQSLNLDQTELKITGGNKVSFENWDTNVSDDFSGIYDDLQNLPDLYNKTEIDNIIGGIETTGGISQNLNLDQNTLSISGGNSISFDNWDTNEADDFSGVYSDLQNIPDLYNKTEIDNIIGGIQTTGGISQNLNLDQNTLSISGGNSISFDNWDTNAADDFSGAYADLQNIPDLYNKTEIDNLIGGIETTGGISQNLNLDQNTLSISGGNSISFDNWDTNVADDFSGAYADLQNKPVLFSGVYTDLQNIPDLYNKSEIDNLITGIETTGSTPQNLNLDQNTLSISGGNSISFDNWDTNAADDFSGVYSDLQNKPDLYNKTEIDNLITGIETTGGISQNLNLDQNTLSISGGNSISFDNWDTNAADDFSGAYADLQNKPVLFSGVYTDLQNIPDLYNKSEIDNLITGIETTGSTPQNLNLDQNTLSISGGNSISFDNWDTNAADDFSGAYADLQNKPALFSGVYADLQNIPDLYNKTEIDNLITGIETTGGISQNLNLDQNTLSISGGNSVSFDNWDTNAADDFSGAYADLQNKPALFSGVYADLQNIPDLYNKTEIDNIITGIETTGGISQNLNLDQNTLSISGGNSISFDNWDTNAADDFDGAYSSLTGAPKVYTQDEVNAIKAEILNTVSTSYMKKPSVNNISSSRSMSQSDVNNTIACTSSATLTINSGFSAMQIGDISNIEVHGTTLTIQGSGVIINGVNSGKATIGNSKDYTGGILRKTGTNTYIVL